jgi:RNA polymerase sigma factor (sigma-70 family)
MEATSLPRRGGIPLPRALLARLGDDHLVEHLRRGNEAAFEVIFDRYHRPLLSFCRHMLGSREEAEDALQHTLLAAHDDIVTSGKEIRLKAWLYTIARNRCLSVLRARREQATENIDISTAGLSDSVQQRADLRELLHDMHALPEDQRAALVLSELGDLSHAEVAQVIGCEVPKVKSLVFQARSALIERRQAREIPCAEIREQLATLRGGALRRGHLRHHLASCEGCREFRDQVKSQRKAMAAVLPVIPTLGLKESALAAVGIGGGSGGAAVAGAGGLAALGSGGLAKVALVAVLASGAAAGGTAATGSGPLFGDDEPPAPAAGGPGHNAAAIAGAGLTAEEVAERKARRAKKSEDRSERSRGKPRGMSGREWAKTRGKGKKKGLYKEPGSKARRKRARKARPAPRAKTERTRPERTPAPTPEPEAAAPVLPPPPPAVEPEPAPASPPEPVVPVEPPATGGGAKGGGGKKLALF